jgi:hypothetical protein
MKVQELRIGNYVDVEGKFERVSDLVRYKNEIWTILKGSENWSRLANECKPISLTVDTLTDGGYFTDQTYCEIFALRDTVIFRIFFGTGNVEYEPCIGTKVTIENINYVHQLQNLYFALTGEELDIEL